jgi:putative addiction module component (TIGR02574 family)
MSSDLSYLLSLDVSKKLELIGVLWRSIDAAGETVSMPDDLVAELDRRKAAAKADPASLVPWDTIKKRLGLTNA